MGKGDCDWLALDLRGLKPTPVSRDEKANGTVRPVRAEVRPQVVLSGLDVAPLVDNGDAGGDLIRIHGRFALLLKNQLEDGDFAQFFMEPLFVCLAERDLQDEKEGKELDGAVRHGEQVRYCLF